MSSLKELVLLHSNDMHGDFLSEELNEQLVGGVSMLSGYVDLVRRTQPNTLYAIAGDMFRGSVIDSEYKGISTIEIMNAISPDVVSIGNHEIDYGVAHLLFLEKCARFPIINANLYIKSNYVRMFRPCLIKEIGGMKVLFIGIITESVLRSTRNEADIGGLVDVEEAAKEVGRICNAYKTTDVDLTVLLTHIGFEEDKVLASLLDPQWGVDLIIGGHSHTYIDQPVEVNGVVIVQAGTGTDQIGRFDLVIDTDKNCVHSYQWGCVQINEDNCPKDNAVETMILSYKDVTDQKYGRVLTRFSKQLMHPTRYRQTEIGSLFTDALADSQSLDIMFMGSGSVRTESLGPLVLYGDLLTAFPYDGPLLMIEVDGSIVERMVRNIFQSDVLEGKKNGFFQVSSKLNITWDDEVKKIVSIAFQGEPLDHNRMYRIGLMKYHLNNFENYFGISAQEINCKERIISTSIRDILEEFLTSHPSIDRVNDGRIQIINNKQY